MEEEETADPLGLIAEMEEREVDQEDGVERGKPEPRDSTLRSLRTRLAWVSDEIGRKTNHGKATRRQRINLQKLKRAHARTLGRGPIRMRTLKTLRERLRTCVKVKTLQKRQAVRKRKEKDLRERVVSQTGQRAETHSILTFHNKYRSEKVPRRLSQKGKTR